MIQQLVDEINKIEYKPNFFIKASSFGQCVEVKMIMFLTDTTNDIECQRLREAYKKVKLLNEHPNPHLLYNTIIHSVISIRHNQIHNLPFLVEKDMSVNFRSIKELAIHLVYQQIKLLELHEINEWLRYEGNLVKKPH